LPSAAAAQPSPDATAAAEPDATADSGTATATATGDGESAAAGDDPAKDRDSAAAEDTTAKDSEPEAGDDTPLAEARSGGGDTATEADGTGADADTAEGEATAAASEAAPAEGGTTPPASEAVPAEGEGEAEAISGKPHAPEPGTDEAGTTPATGEAASAEGDDSTPAAAPAEGEAAPPDTPAAPTRRLKWHNLRNWRDKYPIAARVLATTTTVLAGALIVLALLLPNKPENLRLAEFTRIPVEALLGAVVLVALPRRPRLVAAVLGGFGLGVLTVLNLLDIGFNEFLGRGFNVVLDWPLLTDAQSYLEDSLGKAGAVAASIAAVALVVALLALLTLSVVRLSNLMARHPGTATRTTLVISTVWMTCAALGAQISGVPIASEHTVAVARDRAARVKATIRDERAFAKYAKTDTFGNTPGAQLVPDLRGKDVIFTFIESYGRSAIEDPIMSPGVDRTLDTSTKALAKAGFHAKSGWLTSATYGGSSWLGHSTFLSGLWIDNQQRYRTVTAGDHLTLTSAFKKTGDWRTVGIMPGVQKNWPEGKFYGLDHVYDSRDLGYQGPKFSWSTMPDQYTLDAYQRLEHGKKHDKPLMSEIILTSSHQPWAPIPKTIPQDQVGDGSVYNAIQKAGNKPADVFYNSTRVKQEYGKSIQYSVTSLTQFLERYGNKNTVLVFLGDHQPMARVSGNHASRDVPVSIVAKDPKVLDKIADWGYTDGLKPEHNAPVWKMSSFRDRFLTAYGSTPHPSTN